MLSSDSRAFDESDRIMTVTPPPSTEPLVREDEVGAPISACPYCLAPAETDLVRCERCEAPHHADCYAEAGSCAVFGCAPVPDIEPTLVSQVHSPVSEHSYELLGPLVHGPHPAPVAGPSIVSETEPVSTHHVRVHSWGRLVATAICTALLTAGVAHAIAMSKIEKAHKEGVAEGRHAGYNSGYNSGYDSGSDAGSDSGYDAGYDAGYSAGYNAGYYDSY